MVSVTLSLPTSRSCYRWSDWNTEQIAPPPTSRCADEEQDRIDWIWESGDVGATFDSDINMISSMNLSMFLILLDLSILNCKYRGLLGQLIFNFFVVIRPLLSVWGKIGAFTALPHPMSGSSWIFYQSIHRPRPPKIRTPGLQLAFHIYKDSTISRSKIF